MLLPYIWLLWHLDSFCVMSLFCRSQHPSHSGRRQGKKKKKKLLGNSTPMLTTWPEIDIYKDSYFFFPPELRKLPYLRTRQKIIKYSIAEYVIGKWNRFWWTHHSLCHRNFKHLNFFPHWYCCHWKFPNPL